MPNTEEQKGIESILKKALGSASTETDLSQMRRDWFNNVVLTVEKMGARIENLSSSLFRSKEELIKEINSTKEKLREELRSESIELKGDIKSLEGRLGKTLYELRFKVEAMSQSKDIDQLKLDFLGEITKVKDDWVNQFDPIKIALTSIKAKLAVWAVLWGSLGAGAFALILKYLFGVGTP